MVGDSALLFKYGDVDALRGHLRRLLEDDAFAQAQRDQARQRAASRPGWDEVALATEAFYYRILGR